jgi:hypothetical protein
MIDLTNTRIEATHGTESRRYRDLTHGKMSFVDQLLGEVQATSLGDRDWRRTQMTQEQAPQVTRAHTQAFR